VEAVDSEANGGGANVEMGAAARGGSGRKHAAQVAMATRVAVSEKTSVGGACMLSRAVLAANAKRSPAVMQMSAAACLLRASLVSPLPPRVPSSCRWATSAPLRADLAAL
jgi:hypothetical protein